MDEHERSDCNLMNAGELHKIIEMTAVRLVPRALVVGEHDCSCACLHGLRWWSGAHNMAEERGDRERRRSLVGGETKGG